MENTRDEIGLTHPSNNIDNQQWQDTLSLLKMMQSDYQGTRSQLDKITRVLTERASQINRCLQYAYTTSHGCNNFCLGSVGTETATNQIGKIRLGQSVSVVISPPIMRLEVRCLGRFEVHSGSKQINRWQSAKAKAVLQYLVTKPREPILKDAIIEILWPECSIQAANNNLKAAIHGLRQSLNSLFSDDETTPHVLNIQGSYLVNPEIELKIDVEEFEKHFKLGRRFEKEGNSSLARQEFEKAETLYRGDYLEDEPYEEWTLLRRESLKDSYLFILSKLADYAIEDNDSESCILYCQKILEKDPCREDTYRRLIVCYSRLGQKNRALRWYDICRRTIQRELDAPPDEQTTSLYKRLQNGEML
jgi:LuxR family maltose regulon positive regulatory protein